MRKTTKVWAVAFTIALVARWFARLSQEIDAHNDCDGGAMTSVVVAFMPFMGVLMHAKDILIPDFVEGLLVANVKHLIVPAPHLFNASQFTEPDYSDEDLAWNALPHTDDTGDIVPPTNGPPLRGENQAAAQADLFYLSPSTFYSPFAWNVDWNSSNTRYMNREAIIPQQAAIFNSVARVFAPQIRQMSGFGFVTADEHQEAVRRKAAEIAYSDARRAFRYYLEKYNPGLKRGIFLAGHSQGAEYILRLLRDEFSQNKTMMDALVAAYAVGMPVYKSILKKTYVEGADPSHFYFEPTDPFFRLLNVGEKVSKEVYSDRVCVNPLTWKADDKYADRSLNKGGMHILQFLQNFYYLTGAPNEERKGLSTPRARQLDRIQFGMRALDPALVGARCLDGSLHVDEPPRAEFGSNPLYTMFPVWRFASFPGSNLHPYDFNFFWADVRANAEDRIDAFLKKKAVA